VEYREMDGEHTWYFWDQQIQWFLSNVLEPIGGSG
jgi:S-formylglutathione hydrolase FrmB